MSSPLAALPISLRPKAEAREREFALPISFRHILPQRMHDREKGYSPALKKTGGYSFVPEQEGQRGFLQPPENKARDYYPNFLMGLAPGEAEPEGLRNEPEPNRQPENRGNDRGSFDRNNMRFSNPRTGKDYDVKGRRK